MTVIIKNILPPLIANAAAVSFPAPDWQWWYRYPNRKLASQDPVRIPNGCRVALDMLAAIIPSPSPYAHVDMDFHGAGLHMMPEGSRLAKHTDALRHPLYPWSRLASVVWFASSPVGGELVVGEEIIETEFNTAVIFDGREPHEVRKVINGERKTLSLFIWQVSHNPKGDDRANFSPSEYS